MSLNRNIVAGIVVAALAVVILLVYLFAMPGQQAGGGRIGDVGPGNFAIGK